MSTKIPTTVITGFLGSGKTTLVKLLLRFYDPTDGRILINGVDLREIELDSYYARIGVIFQQFAQYEGRIREQIGYGEIESMEDLEQIRHAARLGGAVHGGGGKAGATAVGVGREEGIEDPGEDLAGHPDARVADRDDR